MCESSRLLGALIPQASRRSRSVAATASGAEGSCLSSVVGAFVASCSQRLRVPARRAMALPQNLARIRKQAWPDELKPSALNSPTGADHQQGTAAALAAPSCAGRRR